MPARKRPAASGARRLSPRRKPVSPSAAAATSFELACPKCGAAQTGAKVTTVLRPEDADGLAALLKGTLNVFTCATCGTPFRLDSPVLYRDDIRHGLIYFTPGESVETLERAEKQVTELLKTLLAPADGTPAPAAGEIPAVTCRLTLTRSQFIEKIMLWRRELDDRVVEYIKCQLLNKKDGHYDPVRMELFFDFTHADAAELGFLILDRESGRPAAGAHVPMELYTELAATFLNDAAVRAELDKLFPGYYVAVSRLL